ncbi:alanine racemase C-terminal domain-containing protein [Microbacterium sp. cx-59]|uniref:alanine racemase C-terminal domain-containing protein n=1 Tax=Microbacterium sp. cx-59 TaxID=2891207 RepID=UPI001E5A8DAE|nr:alanine racemase C-terminal domain-containing protein [Microbacterium sp. cx-59]MCC4907292.1 alanine racemase [Microbacterium sp. cx-59]
MSTDADPRARVFATAIIANVRASGGSVVDVRRDARGHGLADVAAVLLESTDVLLLADPADLARHALSNPRILTSGVLPDVAPAVAFGLQPGTRPALSLRGTVLAVKDLKAGEGVSYGYAFRAPQDTRVALVTGGYAQGIPRSLGNRVAVGVGDARHPIIGRIAMDVCVIDIGDARVARGQSVVYFGDPEDGAPAVDRWAAESGLTALEIVAGVGLHTRREYVR